MKKFIAFYFVILMAFGSKIDKGILKVGSSQDIQGDSVSINKNKMIKACYIRNIRNKKLQEHANIPKPNEKSRIYKQYPHGLYFNHISDDTRISTLYTRGDTSEKKTFDQKLTIRKSQNGQFYCLVKPDTNINSITPSKLKPKKRLKVSSAKFIKSSQTCHKDGKSALNISINKINAIKAAKSSKYKEKIKLDSDDSTTTSTGSSEYRFSDEDDQIEKNNHLQNKEKTESLSIENKKNMNNLSTSRNTTLPRINKRKLWIDIKQIKRSKSTKREKKCVPTELIRSDMYERLSHDIEFTYSNNFKKYYDNLKNEIMMHYSRNIKTKSASTRVNLKHKKNIKLNLKLNPTGIKIHELFDIKRSLLSDYLIGKSYINCDCMPNESAHSSSIYMNNVKISYQILLDEISEHHIVFAKTLLQILIIERDFLCIIYPQFYTLIYMLSGYKINIVENKASLNNIIIYCVILDHILKEYKNKLNNKIVQNLDIKDEFIKDESYKILIDNINKLFSHIFTEINTFLYKRDNKVRTEHIFLISRKLDMSDLMIFSFYNIVFICEDYKKSMRYTKIENFLKLVAIDLTNQKNIQFMEFEGIMKRDIYQNFLIFLNLFYHDYELKDGASFWKISIFNRFDILVNEIDDDSFFDSDDCLRLYNIFIDVQKRQRSLLPLPEIQVWSVIK